MRNAGRRGACASLQCTLGMQVKVLHVGHLLSKSPHSLALWFLWGLTFNFVLWRIMKESAVGTRNVDLSS